MVDGLDAIHQSNGIIFTRVTHVTCLLGYDQFALLGFLQLPLHSSSMCETKSSSTFRPFQY